MNSNNENGSSINRYPYRGIEIQSYGTFIYKAADGHSDLIDIFAVRSNEVELLHEKEDKSSWDINKFHARGKTQECCFRKMYHYGGC